MVAELTRNFRPAVLGSWEAKSEKPGRLGGVLGALIYTYAAGLNNPELVRNAIVRQSTNECFDCLIKVEVVFCQYSRPI